MPYLNSSYSFNIPIPKQIFNDNYPVNPQTFGEKLRKARMDSGLQIKELAEMLGVAEESVINWEKRGITPIGKNLDKVRKILTVF